MIQQLIQYDAKREDIRRGVNIGLAILIQKLWRVVTILILAYVNKDTVTFRYLLVSALLCHELRVHQPEASLCLPEDAPWVDIQEGLPLALQLLYEIEDSLRKIQPFAIGKTTEDVHQKAISRYSEEEDSEGVLFEM